MNAPALAQQFTHLVYLDHLYRLLYVLRQFAYKTGKIRNDRKQTNHKRKNNEETDSKCDKNISLQKSSGSLLPPPVELFALLGRSRLSLLSTNWQSRKLFASAGLYFVVPRRCGLLQRLI